MGPPRPLSPRDRQVHRGHARQRGRAPRKPSAARSSSIRASPLRTSSTRTWRRTSDRRRGRSCASSAKPTGTATIPSCSRGSCTPVATPDSSNESIAAHGEAIRLDPNIRTGLEQTLLMTGDIDELLAVGAPSSRRGRRRWDSRHRARARRTTRRGAPPLLLEMRQTPRIPTFQLWTDRLLLARSPERRHAHRLLVAERR